jgi:hypothetical protein
MSLNMHQFIARPLEEFATLSFARRVSLNRLSKQVQNSGQGREVVISSDMVFDCFVAHGR